MKLLKKTITEKDKVHEQWYKDAAAPTMTMKTLPKFLMRLTKGYNHDYGTICHAIAAGGIATMWAMNRTPQGGITGFQAGCVMWSFIKNWQHMEGSLRLVQYNNMLFPQYADQFEKTISRDIWEDLQKQAKEKLAKENKGTHKDVIKHWESIAGGMVPFGYTVTED